MPIQHTVHKDKRLLVSHWSGVCNDENILEPYLKTYAGPDWQPDFDEILIDDKVDLRDLTAFGVRNFYLTMKEYYTKPFRLAVVTADLLPYGLARMYSLYVGEGPPEVQVYRTVDEALHWLNLSRADIGLPEKSA